LDAGYLVTRGGKADQCRIDFLNLIETFLGNFGSVGKASLRRVGGTIGKKVENAGRTIREFSTIKSLATVLLVIISNNVEPKTVG
jgi:hypothetical protein